MYVVNRRKNAYNNCLVVFYYGNSDTYGFTFLFLQKNRFVIRHAYNGPSEREEKKRLTKRSPTRAIKNRTPRELSFGEIQYFFIFILKFMAFHRGNAQRPSRLIHYDFMEVGLARRRIRGTHRTEVVYKYALFSVPLCLRVIFNGSNYLYDTFPFHFFIYSKRFGLITLLVAFDDPRISVNSTSTHIYVASDENIKRLLHIMGQTYCSLSGENG